MPYDGLGHLLPLGSLVGSGVPRRDFVVLLAATGLDERIMVPSVSGSMSCLASSHTDVYLQSCLALWPPGAPLAGALSGASILPAISLSASHAIHLNRDKCVSIPCLDQKLTGAFLSEVDVSDCHYHILRAW
jgi:hypothetical protein